ncbi:MAG: tetratricopeptide repeat protein [Actinomycetota bacterium]|nr:tetratricopeptide repeat protein [Actinomycetota bacterium]MDD5667398.1 tetratricopeptide repeat protein [Actinomycetota bacterium]
MPETTRCFNCTKEIPVGVESCPVCGFALSGGRIEAIKEAAELNSRAQLHDSKGEWEQSVPMYQRAVELYPEFVVAHYNLGIALGRTRRYDDAKEALTRAIKLKPDFAAAYSARGDIDAGAGDYDSAVCDYSKALELYPDYAQAYYKRALAWMEKDCAYEARQDLEDYLFYKPHDSRARRRLEKLKEGG